MIDKEIVGQYPVLTSARFYYGNGEFHLKPIGRIAGVELWFSGVPSIETRIPDGWDMKFIIPSMAVIWSIDSYQPLDEMIFEYEGMFHVKRCLCIDYQGNKIVCSGYNKYLSYWNYLSSKWDYAGNWKQYNVDYQIGDIVKKRKIKKKERTAEGGYTSRVPVEGTESVSSTYEGGGGGGSY